MRRIVIVVMVAYLLLASSVWGANSVSIESKSLGMNAVDAPVRVLLENDFNTQYVIVPLVIREITPGVFPTALKLSYAERLDPAGGSLTDLIVSNHHGVQTGAACSPDGFLNTYLFNDTLKHPVTANPLAALFARLTIFPSGDLLPGADASGSIVLTMDLGSVPGSFEIDTTCVDPQNHLLFGDQSNTQVTPTFTKGVINVGANVPPVAQCTDVTVNADGSCTADASINAGSYDPDGGPVVLAQDPPGPYPLGVTAVQLTVTDTMSESATCMGFVTVEDATPPTITCHADTIVVVEPGSGGAIVDFTTDASDACGGVVVTCDPPSGSMFPSGLTLVQCTATDDYGNTSTCEFRIFVHDAGAFCNDKPEDVNCDGVSDVLDLAQVIDHVYFGVPSEGPCCGTQK